MKKDKLDILASTLTKHGIPCNPDDLQTLEGGASGKSFHRLWNDTRSFSNVLIQFTDPASLLKYTTLSKVLADNKVPVPSLIHSFPEDLIVITSDGGRTLERTFEALDGKQKSHLYKDAILVIQRIQALPVEVLPEPVKRFDHEKYRFEADYHIKTNLIENYLDYKLSSGDGSVVHDGLNSLTHKLLGAQFLPAHRDFQSTNILLAGNSMTIIDFQDLLLAHPLYDLVSLLEDAYVTIPQELKEEHKMMFKQYLEDIKLLTFEFASHYSLVMIQRKLHDAGAFAAAAQKLGKQSFNRYISSTINVALTEMLSHKFLQPFQSLLTAMVRRHEEKGIPKKSRVDLF